MNIFICGLAASGKSTLSKKIAKSFSMDYISSSNLLKEIMGYKNKDVAFWDKEGRSLFSERDKKNFDELLDKKQLELAKESNKVFDSWIMPWLYKGKSIKIYLKASKEVRAKRMSKRDSLDIKQSIEYLKERDKKTQELFKKKYGIDILEINIFDLVINTDFLDIEEVFLITKKYISFYLEKI